MTVNPLPDREARPVRHQRRGRPAGTDQLVSLTVAITVEQRKAVEDLAFVRGYSLAAITREILAAGLACLMSDNEQGD